MRGRRGPAAGAHRPCLQGSGGSKYKRGASNLPAHRPLFTFGGSFIKKIVSNKIAFIRISNERAKLVKCPFVLGISTDRL